MQKMLTTHKRLSLSKEIKSYTLHLLLILSIAVFSACSTKPKNNEQQSPLDGEENIVQLDSVQKKNAGLKVAFPASKTISTTIRLNGLIEVPPQNLVSVSFPIGGYLKNTQLLPGYPVRKGQVIATMEDVNLVQLQQDYLSAKAKMEYLSVDMQRQKELSDADASSKKNYQQVSSEYKMQEVLLHALAEKLRVININPDKLTINNISRTTAIYSPIDGYVSKVNVNIGKYVNPSDVLFELVNPSDLHAVMTVFEKDFYNFKAGIKGKVFLTDKPSEQYNVEVILATRNMDENRSGLIHCHFLQANHKLLPGMYLTGIFEPEKKEVTGVPDDAVVRYMGQDYVFVAKDDSHFILTPVQTGNRENGFVELLPAENIDWNKTQVVTQGAYSLLGKLKNKMEDE